MTLAVPIQMRGAIDLAGFRSGHAAAGDNNTTTAMAIIGMFGTRMIECRRSASYARLLCYSVIVAAPDTGLMPAPTGKLRTDKDPTRAICNPCCEKCSNQLGA